MIKKLTTNQYYYNNRSKKLIAKMSIRVMTIAVIVILFLSTIYLTHSIYAQKAAGGTDDSARFGGSDNMAGSDPTINNWDSVYNLTVSGKVYPIKYSTTTGRLLDIVIDKDKTTLLAIISSPLDKGMFTIELPRNIIDDKGQANTDSKYTVRVDGKDSKFQETSNNPTARTLAIDFPKDVRLIEIIGTQTVQ
jgi:hypothetical protein